ncbi:radical SAM protein [bacterium]|nr:radical SAM protein [bacterium]
MKVIAKVGREDIALVYLAELEGRFVEFVESVEPPIPREDKWVIIVSTLFGCPVNCPICDAGGFYHGPISKEGILAQIDYPVIRRYPDRVIPAKKFKVQFARLGEPALNPAVLDVLEELPDRFIAPGLIPCISTIAPRGREKFFQRMLEIKESRYNQFQLQFSVHTTDPQLRDKLIPAPKWDFKRIAQYGALFYKRQGRKVTLNFALAENSPLKATVLYKYFDPAVFFIKLTPVNPTLRSQESNIRSAVNDPYYAEEILDSLRVKGYEVLLSIGELEENRIGSNCGQYVRKFLEMKEVSQGMYEYNLEKVNQE